MKVIGLLGGMSWESTLEYYRFINTGIKQRVGSLHSAKIALYSIDFAELEALQHAGDWQGAAQLLADAAQKVQVAGAEAVLICANTMHKVAPEVESAIDIPLLHIADAAAEELLRRDVNKVGLLGTAFTMEQAFYKDRLYSKYGFDVLVPPPEQRAEVHRIIYEELCVGKFLAASKTTYLQTIADLAEQGAEAVILGCTEIGLLIKPEDTPVPVLDTTLLHAQKAVEWALS